MEFPVLKPMGLPLLKWGDSLRDHILDIPGVGASENWLMEQFGPDRQPTSWLDSVNEKLTEYSSDFLERLHDQEMSNRPRPRPRQRPRRQQARQQARPQASPYAGIMQQIASAPSAPAMSAKEQQKAINQAILAARAPYDQSIVEARAGLTGALRENQKVSAAINPTKAGAAARDDAYRAELDTAAKRMAAEVAAGNNANIAGGGEAATRAAQADDIAQAMIASQQAGGAAQSQNQALMGDTQATGIDNYLAAQQADTEKELRTDAARNIARLQRERAASIAEAKASTRTSLAESSADAAKVAADMQNQRLNLALKAMGMQQSEQHRQWQREQKSKTDPMDAIKLVLEMSQKQSRIPFDKDGDGKTDSWGYGPTFPRPYVESIVGQVAPWMQGTPFARYPAQAALQDQSAAFYQRLTDLFKGF